MNDPDWIYRTTSQDLDFQWGKYDRVLRDVLVDTIVKEPKYVLYSLFIAQPKAVISTLFGDSFLRSKTILKGAPWVVLVLGLVLLYLRRVGAPQNNFALPLAFAFAGVILPVVCAAVFEVRVIELFYIFLVAILVGFSALVLIGLELVKRRWPWKSA